MFLKSDSSTFAENVRYLMYKYEIPIFVWERDFGDVIKYVHNIGFEPAGLTVHPPPQNDREWVHFFVWVDNATKIFSSKKKWIL